MKYMYDGFLPERTTEYIKDMSRNYHHILEISKLPETWGTWNRENLKDHQQRCSDDYGGEDYTRTTKMYGTVQGVTTVFLFFVSEEERQMFINAFGELVVNEKPFKTII